MIINDLRKLGFGSFPCGKDEGWLLITDESGDIDVVWTSETDCHYPLKSKKNCISVQYNEDGPIEDCIFESAITMHIVDEKEQRKVICSRMMEYIYLAINEKGFQEFDKRCKKTEADLEPIYFTETMKAAEFKMPWWFYVLCFATGCVIGRIT